MAVQANAAAAAPDAPRQAEPAPKPEPTAQSPAVPAELTK